MNNQTKFGRLPRGNQIFLGSYLILLLLTLASFIATAFNWVTVMSILVFLLLLTLVINVVSAFVK